MDSSLLSKLLLKKVFGLRL